MGSCRSRSKRPPSRAETGQCTRHRWLPCRHLDPQCIAGGPCDDAAAAADLFALHAALAMLQGTQACGSAAAASWAPLVALPSPTKSGSWPACAFPWPCAGYPTAAMPSSATSTSMASCTASPCWMRPILSRLTWCRKGSCWRTNK